MEKAPFFSGKNLAWLAIGIGLLLGGIGCGGPTSSKEIPQLAVAPDTLDFGETRNSLTLTISNAGTGALHWSIAVPSEGWISLNQHDGTVVTTPIDVDVRIDREKAPAGQHEIKLVVTGGGASEAVVLRATIRRVGRLSLSPLTLNFGETSSQQQVVLRNDGGETLTWSAASVQEWIAVAPTSGSLAAGDQQTVTVTVDRQKLGSGVNQGSVDFTSTGGSSSVAVLATGSSAGTLSASPLTLDFGTRGTRLSLELRRLGGSGTLDWTVTASDAWIDPKTTSGSLLIGDTRTIFVEVKRQGLDPGTYQGSLTFRWSGGETQVVVAMRVADEPALALSGESLEVGAAATFTFSIINAGSGNLNWVISESTPWLQLTPLEGTTATIPRTITGTIDRTGMVAGQYEAMIHIDSDGGSRDLPLVMEVPLPSVEITQGPEEGAVLNLDQVAFRFRAVNAYGKAEYSTKLDDGQWTAWSQVAEVGYQHLEESSLVGAHLFQVRVRADAGESAPLLRRFSVDAVQGPALRLSPKVLTISTGQTALVEIIAEEVVSMLAARIALTFDATRLELQKVEQVGSFLGQRGGTLVMPNPEIDNAGGRLDLSLGVAGGSQAGVEGTGVLARLHFRAKRSGVIQLLLGSGTAARDLDNRPILIRTVGAEITVQ